MSMDDGPDTGLPPPPTSAPTTPPGGMPTGPPVVHPPVARGPGMTLIVLGALSTLANGLFVGLVLSGDIEERLRDGGYEVENEGLFATAVLTGTLLGILAIVAGILVLRREPIGRVMGIIAATLLGVGYIVNLTSGLGNFFSFVLLVVCATVIIQLGKARDAFIQNQQRGRTPTTVVLFAAGAAVAILLAAAVLFVVMLSADEASESNRVTAGSEAGADGGSVFSESCASCHGATGDGGVGPALADGRVVERFPDLADQIVMVTDGRGTMPAFGSRLSPEDIEAVVEYTRSL